MSLIVELIVTEGRTIESNNPDRRSFTIQKGLAYRTYNAKGYHITK